MTMYKPCPVLLFSNDHNLCVKAMVHDLCVWECSEGGPDQQVAYLCAHIPPPVQSDTSLVNDDDDYDMEDTMDDSIV
jgi:hypothetical protein